MEQRNGRVRSQTQAACWACLPFARKQNLSAVTTLLFCSGIDCKIVWSLGSLTHSLRSWVQIWWKIHLAAHYSCSPQLTESDRVTSKLPFFIVLRVTPGGSCPTFQLPPSLRIRPLAIFPVFHTCGPFTQQGLQPVPGAVSSRLSQNSLLKTHLFSFTWLLSLYHQPDGEGRNREKRKKIVKLFLSTKTHFLSLLPTHTHTTDSSLLCYNTQVSRVASSQGQQCIAAYPFRQWQPPDLTPV